MTLWFTAQELLQGSKLTLALLPEATWNRLGQVVFRLTCPTGKLTKYSVLNSFKQDYSETNFKSAFVAIKWSMLVEKAVACFILHSTLWSLLLTICLVILIMAINISSSHADFSILRRVKQLVGTKCYAFFLFFSEKKFSTLAALTIVSDITSTTLRCVKTTSRILQFLCWDYVENLLAPIAKRFFSQKISAF